MNDKSILFITDEFKKSISDKTYTNLINVLSSQIQQLVDNGYTSFYTCGNDSIDLLIFFVIQKLKNNNPSIINSVLNYKKIDNQWYNKMLQLCNEKQQNIDIDKFIKTNKCSIINVSKSNINKNSIINIIYTEGQMRIFEKDNRNEITEETLALLKKIIETKSKEALHSFTKRMNTLIETQNEKSVEFEDTELDRILFSESFQIKEITDNTVVFDGDDKTIVVTLK